MTSPLSKLIADSYMPQSQHNVFVGLVQSSAPALEPITTAVAKSHLRVDISDDDTLIDSLVTAARRWVESQINKSLITQTWVLTLNSFPSTDSIKLPRGPVQSVTTVNSYDSDDTESTFAATSYLVDVYGDRICLNLDAVWPSDLRPSNGAIITYVAGYGDAASDVPDDLKQVILLLVGHWYENREAVGASMSEAPLTVQALLSPYRDLRL